MALLVACAGCGESRGAVVEGPGSGVSDLFSRVKPAGTLVVGNFGGDPRPPAAWMISYTTDWNLRYRSRAEMTARGEVLEDTQSMEVVTEETGTHLFVRAQKISQWKN